MIALFTFFSYVALYPVSLYLSTKSQMIKNWILVYETSDFRRIFQSNVTIGNKGKQTSAKKQNLKKIPNKVKIKKAESYYKNDNNMN